MSDQIVDDFYTARNLLYLGAYPQALANLSQQTHLSGALELEKQSLRLRAYLGQQNYSLILDEIPATATSPELLTIRQLVLIKQQGSASPSVVGVVDELVADSNNLQSPSFVAIAAQVLVIAQKTDDALKILALHPKNLECVAMTVVTYLAIDRVDLAQKLIARVRTWAEDAPIAQLAEAWTSLFVGGPKYNEAFYIFEELAQASSVSTVPLLNALAVCKMHLQQYPEAISLLQEALEKNPNSPDTLANLVVCANHAGQSLETKTQYLDQLKHAAPNHPFVLDLEAKDAEFDALKNKF
ncbi:hypothetical protein GGF49_004752 [Coemansia sp. RSA 1853]|nr:hypothetical protein LPJ76_004819 [Coemansia sp. RSA 638]KAJ2540064.1 hypothetical protein GGF49_004752 [Coemansia sp. RSA 1853]